MRCALVSFMRCVLVSSFVCRRCILVCLRLCWYLFRVLVSEIGVVNMLIPEMCAWDVCLLWCMCRVCVARSAECLLLHVTDGEWPPGQPPPVGRTSPPHLTPSLSRTVRTIRIFSFHFSFCIKSQSEQWTPTFSSVFTTISPTTDSSRSAGSNDTLLGGNKKLKYSKYLRTVSTVGVFLLRCFNFVTEGSTCVCCDESK